MNDRAAAPNEFSPRRSRPRRAGGAALLVCVFVIAMMSLVVIAMIDTETSQLAALRNTIDYERALYLAGAAVHHAMAEVEADFSWRGTVTEGTYPNDDSYSATAADGASGTVLVTGTGVAGTVVRTLQVTLAEGG
jgi:Tfp pilus assembly protein PilX